MQQQPTIHFFASMQVHCATCMQFRKRIQSFKRSTTTSRDPTNVMFGVTRHLHSAWGMPLSWGSGSSGYDARQSAFHTVKIYVPRRPASLRCWTKQQVFCKCVKFAVPHTTHTYTYRNITAGGRGLRNEHGGVARHEQCRKHKFNVQHIMIHFFECFG